MMANTATRRWTWRSAASLAAAITSAIVLMSCEMPPPTEPLPTLLDIRPSPTDGGEDGSADDQPNANKRVIALIHRIDVPLDVPTDALWDLVDEQAVPLRTLGMWRTNGIRIGFLHAEHAPDFVAALPSVLGESRAKLLGSPYPSTIRTTPRLRRPVEVDLTDPPRSPQVIQARGGRLQLLAKIGRDENGTAFLELTPHHYKPKGATLLPRSPLEKELDGQVYESLMARLPLPPDRAVVVCLYRPWPVAIEDEPTEPSTPEETPLADQTTGSDLQPGTQTPQADASNTSDDGGSSKPAQTDRKPPPIPNHLGKALLAGTRAGTPVQILLIISTTQEPPNATDPAS